jgi:hypothetical protein
VSKPAISYASRLDTTPEAELGALTSVYAFILQKHQERQRATRPGGPYAAKENKDGSRHFHRNT